LDLSNSEPANLKALWRISMIGVIRDVTGNARHNRIVSGPWISIMWPILAALILVTPLYAQRTKLKPGINIFSPQQDVEVGRETAKQAEQQLPMLNDQRIDGYLTRLGKRLAEKAPGDKFPYEFRGVNDLSINAFALPGGFLFINRGTIEAADDEAQLAGVIGHEVGHAALRHGTNQVTKAYLAQAPLAILGGVVGSKGALGVVAQIGAGFGVNSILLKYSRDAERQADIVGTQILYDCGYDPRAMAQFFEKLAAEGGKRAPQFFSSHPNPENRADSVDAEVQRLGGYSRGMKTDSPEFQAIKGYVKSLPPPPKSAAKSPGVTSGARTERPQPPSSRYQSYSNSLLQLQRPDNWQISESNSTATLAPQGGLVDSGQGSPSLAYGMMIAIFQPQKDSRGVIDLAAATDQLIKSVAQSNPRLQVSRRAARTRLDGEEALSTLLTNESAIGGQEVIWLVTVLRPEGLVYFVSVAPEKEYDGYRRAFDDVIRSVRFSRR
jgi:Zn-dependent protease with chaperone function